MAVSKKFALYSLTIGDEWQKLSGLFQGEQRAGWVKEITPKTVIIEVMHFSIFGLSIFKRPLKRTMMMFMKPATNAVYITAYAVQESLKQVRTVICFVI